jgi:PKD repeat protein
MYNGTAPTLDWLLDFTMNTDTVILSGLGTVTVTNTSVNAEQWFWDFGDGSFVETAENPVHAYTRAGHLYHHANCD